MSHIFDVSQKTKLERAERINFLKPVDTLNKFQIKPSDVVADIGCGTGVFTFPASDILKAGKVFAIDISSEMLSYVKERIEKEGNSNIVVVQSDSYDFKIPDQSCDFSLACTVLHEIDNKQRFLNEAARICKPGGKIAIIEFNETNNNFGPPLDRRLSRSLVSELLINAGFKNTSNFDISEVFYAVTAIR